MSLEVNHHAMGLRRLSNQLFSGLAGKDKDKDSKDKTKSLPRKKDEEIANKFAGMTMMSSSAWTKSFKPSPIAAGPAGRASCAVISDELDDDELEVEKNEMIELVDEVAFNADWYLDNVPAYDAHECLKDKGNGAFVITTGQTQNCLVLYYVFNGSVKTCTMYGDASGIHMSSSSLVFDSLSELIRHYSHESASELPCLLDPTVKIVLPQATAPPAPDYEVMTKRPSQAYEIMTDANIPGKRGSSSALPSYEVMNPNIKRPLIITSPPRGSADQAPGVLSYEVMTGPNVPTFKRAVVAPARGGGTAQEPGQTELSVQSPNKSPYSRMSMAPEGRSSQSSEMQREISPGGILRRVHMAAALKPCDTGRKLRFNEDSICDTRGEMQNLRGAVGYVDEHAIAHGYYVSNLSADQASDKLYGSKARSFLVVDGADHSESLILLHVNDQGKILEKTIQFRNPNIALEGSEHTFESLTSLLRFYADDNEEDSCIICLSEDDDDGKGEDEDEGRLAGDRRAYMKRRVSSQYMMFENPTDEPWFQPGLSRATANSLIEFEPTGTFVMWDDQDNPGTYVLSFVKNGRLNHLNIEMGEGGFTIEEANKYFPNLKDLVKCYCNENAPEIGCKLRAPRRDGSMVPTSLATSQPTPPPSPQPLRKKMGANDPNRPPWLQLHQPKAQALAPIANAGDGAFVIRSSESRPECLVLSYKHRGQINYELIFFYGAAIGYALECASDKKFLTLNELVMYYESPRPELRYPLVNSFNMAPPEPIYAESKRKSVANVSLPGTMEKGRSLSPGGPMLSRSPSERSRRESKASQMPPMQRGSSKAELTRSDSRPELTRGNSKPDLKRGNSKGDLKRGNSKPMLKRLGSKGDLKSFGSREDLMQRRSSKGEFLGFTRSASKRQQQGVTVIRTNGERLDQRAAMQPWCCMNMTKDECLGRLTRFNQNGQFLVRRPSDQGFCVLSYIFKGKIEHAAVEDTPNGLHVVKSPIYQPNLSTLIAYYKLPEQVDLHCSLVV